MKNTLIKKESIVLDQKSFTLIDIFIIIARHIKLVILVPILSCVFMVIYLKLFSVPLFTSNTKIMSSTSNNSDMNNAAGLAAQFGIIIPSNSTSPQWSYPVIVKSRLLAIAMLERSFSTKEFGPQKPLLNILTNNNQKHKIEVLTNIGINKLISMINIELSSSNIYNLSVTAKEPYFAKDLVTAVIEELDQHIKKYNNAKISETRQFIEDRIGQTNVDLNTAEEALKNFRSSNRRIENSPALQLQQQRLLREVTVLTGVFTTLKSQLETAKIQEYKDSNNVIVVDSPNTPLSPSKPNKRFIIVMVGFLSLGFAILIAFLVEAYTHSLKTEKNKIDELKSLLIPKLFK